tara:strand:+ start:287 stop:556 length:270 start_codon:yes stop_codon:yes gene_type:complete
MSTTLQIEDVKRDFLQEVATLLGPCKYESKTILYEIVAKSGYNYMIEYDQEPKGFSNVLIYLRKGENIVFNGFCKTQHDIAQVLRMVII